jgi:hypothetical protein
MKPLLLCLAAALVLALAADSRADLGDTPQQLKDRFGAPISVEKTTGDIPTQYGYYLELAENSSTNLIWMAPSKDGHYLELIEKRTRCTYFEDSLRVLAYLGIPNEKYGGIDYSGKCAREVVDGPIRWEKNIAGDKVGHPLPLTQETIGLELDANKGHSTWSDDWEPMITPGRFIRSTADRTRNAIAYGVSPQEVYRLEVIMADSDTASAK